MEQLLLFPQFSRVHRHKGQEGQLQPSALTLCLTGAREFHLIIPASSPYLPSELESTTYKYLVVMCLVLRSCWSLAELSAGVLLLVILCLAFLACSELGQISRGAAVLNLPLLLGEKLLAETSFWKLAVGRSLWVSAAGVSQAHRMVTEPEEER